MIKFIALDLDGTFLKHDHTIDSETLKILKELKDVRYAIATGRCLSFVEDIVSTYKLDCDLILNNGHEFISSDKKIKLSYPFEVEHLKKVVNIFFEYSCDFMMYDSNGKKYTFVELEKLYESHIRFTKLNYGKNIEHLLDKPLFSKENYLRDTILLNSIDELNNLNILKIDARATNKELSIKAIEELKLLDNTALSSSYESLIEVCDSSMSKGSMIKKVIDIYGISLDEVAAFGDSTNDIEMLDMAKYSFAMGSASDKVKSHAKFITDTNDNQGILKGLQQLKELKIIL